MIDDLHNQISLLELHLETQAKNMQERLNSLTRDFVKKYDTLEAEYKKYKLLSNKEMECLQAIAVSKDNLIEE